MAAGHGCLILSVAMKNTVTKTVRTFNVSFSRHTGLCVAKVDGRKSQHKMTETQVLDWAAHTRLCGHTVNLKFL